MIDQKLKTIIAWRDDHSVFDSGINEKYYKYRETCFDEAENIISETTYFANGRKRMEIINEYDENNRLVSRTDFNIEENTSEKNVYKYDNAGNLLEEDKFFGDDLYEKHRHAYNDKGGKIRTEILDGENEIIEKDDFVLNENGKVLKHTHAGIDGEIEWELVLIYNDAGTVIEEVHTDFQSGLVEKTRHEINANQLRVQSEVFGENEELIELVTEEYDDSNRSTKSYRETNRPYAAITTHTLVYDEQGRVLNSEWFDGLNNYLISKEHFVYDENNQLKTHEVYQLNSGQGMQKNHYTLRLEYL